MPRVLAKVGEIGLPQEFHYYSGVCAAILMNLLLSWLSPSKFDNNRISHWEINQDALSPIDMIAQVHILLVN
jgi:hypothetical protein